MQASSNSNKSCNGDMGIHECLHGTLAYKLGLVMGQHVEIFAIYRQHRHYRAFSGQTATRECSCYLQLPLTTDALGGRRSLKAVKELKEALDRVRFFNNLFYRLRRTP